MVLRLDKEKIAHCFRRSLPTYDQAARVQRQLAARLLASLDILPAQAFDRVLEIGCGTGVFTEMLCREKRVGELFLNDLVIECEAVVSDKLGGSEPARLRPWFGDIETMALPETPSLVVSGATFQWFHDLPSFLARLARELESGTWLAFSLFGPGTLAEFSSLSSVELNYLSDSRIQALLKDDFVLETRRTFHDRLFFSSVREVMGHIRATGVGGVGEYRWNKSGLRRFEEEYSREFGGEMGLPVSYSSSCFVARRR
ncbi:MAG: methyltransferase domain-containing protein [Thermodesulfobacteriota bacterium]